MAQQNYPAYTSSFLTQYRPSFMEGEYNGPDIYCTPELSSPGSVPDSASIASQEDGYAPLRRTHKRSSSGPVGSTSSIDFVQQGGVGGYGFPSQSNLGVYLQPKESFPMTPSPDMAHSWPVQPNVSNRNSGPSDHVTTAGAHVWTPDDRHATTIQNVRDLASAEQPSELSSHEQYVETKVNERRKRRIQNAKGKGKRTKKSGYTVILPMSERAKEPEFCEIEVKSMLAFVQRGREERLAERGTSGKVRRPMNCFMLYRSAYNALANKLGERESDQKAISSFAGESWKVETPEIRQFFKDLAEIEKKGHQEAFPTWKFDPVKAKSAKKNIAMLPNEVENDDEHVDDPEHDDQNLWQSSQDFEQLSYGHGISLDDTVSFHQSYTGTPDMTHQISEPGASWQHTSPSSGPSGGIQTASFDYINVGRSAPQPLQNLASVDYCAEQSAVPNDKLAGVTDIRFSLAQKPSSVTDLSDRLTPAATPAIGWRRELPSELPSQKVPRSSFNQGRSPAQVVGQNYREFLGRTSQYLKARMTESRNKPVHTNVSDDASDAGSGSCTPQPYQTAMAIPSSQSISNWSIPGTSYTPDLDFNSFIQEDTKETGEKFPPPSQH